MTRVWDSISFDAIAVAAAGDDEFRAEFFADVGNVNVEQVGKRAFVFVEQMLVKLRARDDFAAMQREKFHERVFARGQFDRLFLERNISRAVSIFISPISMTFVVLFALRRMSARRRANSSGKSNGLTT